MMRRVVVVGMLVGVLGLAACRSESEKNYGIVNTPLVIRQLTGTWVRQYAPGEVGAQTLTLRPEGCGTLRLSTATPVADITYRVDGLTLTLQYYFDDVVPRNWRTRTLVYQYQLTGDTLTLRLIRHGKIETWRKSSS